jgi:hypothetical protein
MVCSLERGESDGFGLSGFTFALEADGLMFDFNGLSGDGVRFLLLSLARRSSSINVRSSLARPLGCFAKMEVIDSTPGSGIARSLERRTLRFLLFARQAGSGLKLSQSDASRSCSSSSPCTYISGIIQGVPSDRRRKGVQQERKAHAPDERGQYE